jgi:hypothetical protein
VNPEGRRYSLHRHYRLLSRVGRDGFHWVGRRHEALPCCTKNSERDLELRCFYSAFAILEADTQHCPCNPCALAHGLEGWTMN